MILVTLGTQDKEFKRLLKHIDECINKGVIKEEVIVQAGHTKFQSKYMKIFDFLPMEEYEKYFKKARVLITHGGVSSIFDGLKHNVPVIGVARKAKYKEHTNDHQIEILEKFATEGYILYLKELTNLDKLLKQAKTFKAKKFISNNENMIKFISDYIDNN